MNANVSIEIVVDRTMKNVVEWFSNHFQDLQFNLNPRLVEAGKVSRETFVIMYGQEFYPYHTTSDPNYRIFSKSEDIMVGAGRDHFRFPTVMETLMLAAQKEGVFQAGRRVLAPLQGEEGFLLLTKDTVSGQVIFDHLKGEEADIRDFILLVEDSRRRSHHAGEHPSFGSGIRYKEWQTICVGDQLSDAVDNDWRAISILPSGISGNIRISIERLWDRRPLCLEVEWPEGGDSPCLVLEVGRGKREVSYLFSHPDALVVKK